MRILTFFLIVLFILSLFSCQQSQSQENHEDTYLSNVEITSSLHFDHIGQITFMKDYVPIEAYSKENMIESFDISSLYKDDIDINIRAFMGNTLTNYLKEIAPELSINELVSQGNFQFSFYVDDLLIYKENLNHGAGSPLSKNRNTSLCVPLISSSKADSWGRFMWSRFMLKGGGRKALSNGDHHLRIEMRPYVETDKLLVGNLIAKGELHLKTFDSSIESNQETMAVQAIETYSEWEISSKPFVKGKIEELNKKIDQGYFKDVTSVVVLNNGKIQLEEYFNDNIRADIRDTRSVGKSVIGMLVGLAIDKGYLKNEKQTLGEFYELGDYKNYSEIKADISIKDLLTMTSSFAGSDMDQSSLGSEDNIQNSQNWMDYVLNLPIDNQRVKNKSWDYFTGGVMILGDILEKVTPDGIEAFAEKELFGPLNISNYKWFYTPQGLVYGGGGLQMSSLDLVKIGTLYQNEGKWRDRQIVSPSWIKQTMTPYIQLPEEAPGNYGYLLYSMDFTVEKEIFKVWYASGNGGNKIYIFKDLPIVIVITATAYNTLEGFVQPDQMVSDYILPAILN